LVGLIWSIFFIEGIRVILLTNWHFDIFRTTHWQHAWNLWLSGWVIDEAKEWAFILIIFTAVPVWITVWAALSTVRWGYIFELIGKLPLKAFNLMFGKQVQKLTNTASVKVVKKKKSYKEIRPRSLRPPLDDNLAPRQPLSPERKAALSGVSPNKTASSPSFAATPTPAESKEFTHSLFEMGDDDTVDFDLFGDTSPEPTPAPEAKAPPAAQPKPDKRKDSASDNNSYRKKNDNATRSASQQNQPTRSKSNANSTFEQLKAKGYEIITGATIKNTFIDFIGISKSSLCLCLNDKEPGDWLADEERFNDEEPLWFSESSHRISPVRKVKLALTSLQEKLSEADLSFETTAFVIEQIGNIINAEDMFDIWNEIGVKVTRIDRGTPKEIPLFAKTLEEADGAVDKAVLDKFKKILRNIA
jgi:hypothetical protein